MSAQPLPELLDIKGIMAEGGITYGAAREVVRNVARTRIGRRVFVRRADVHAYLLSRTVDADGMPISKDAA